MSLLKINDINEEIEAREQEEKSVAIGIDLGTSNSVVSCFINEKVEIIKIDEKSNLLPSLVVYLDNKVLVGQEAKDLIGDKIVLKSIKKLMGRGFAEISINEYNYHFAENQDNKTIKIQLENRIVTPEEVSAEILKVLKEKAESTINKKVEKAVITVPAYFDEGARVATKNAAKLAGLEVLRLINEPTAAALAYGLDKGAEGIYLVYDLGGGTFDISILKLDKGIFKVLATAGDTSLGGDDVDDIIYNKIIDKLKNKELTKIQKTYILNIAKEIKEDFVKKDLVKKSIEINSESINFDLSLQEFNNSIGNFINKTLEISRQVLEDSKVKEEDIKGVILVGGSTRLLELQRKLEAFFGIKPLCDINPDEIVALGAGYQAAMLSGNAMDSLLLDVIPLSLGLEIAGGIVEKIIPRNSLIPIAKKQEFTTSKDGQTSMMIHILQGERELVDDLRSLGKFTLKGIPALPAGVARIGVSFIVDADGLLSVEAEESITGIKQKIEIKPSWGLDFEDMREMIEKSMIYADSDITKRLLLSAKVEAENLINIVTKALKEDGNLISQNEQKDIEKAVLDLENEIKLEDREKIELAQNVLEKVTTKFAEKRMEFKIKEILEGKSVDAVEREIDEVLKNNKDDK